MSRVYVVKMAACAVMLGFLSGTVSAQSLLKNNHPTEYIVKKGDTLWDIAGVFLQSPWLWPSIWEKNSQIKNPHLIYPNDVVYLLYRDGKPYLSTTAADTGKLSPKIRVGDRFTPITSIPKSALQAFVSTHRIVDPLRFDKMPYVLAGVGARNLLAKGDQVFVRGVLDPQFNYYHIYRKGKTFGIEEGFATQNTEIIKVGSLQVVDKQGDITRAVILDSAGLVKKGDIIVRAQELDLSPLYYLAAGPAELSGKIVASVNDSFQIAMYDGVVLNLGVGEGVTAGHIFDIIKAPTTVVDPRSEEEVVISNQVSGKLMIVNVFENLSYGVILNATDSIYQGDTIQGIK